MEVVKTDKLLCVISKTCNRAIEDLIDEYWRPPEFYAIYMIVGNDGNVLKYRKEQRWFATTKRTSVDMLVEHFKLLFD
jgi:hypothetical protein